MAKTIVALYDDFETAQRVVSDLMDAGFNRENVSIVANDVSGEYGRQYTDRDITYVDTDDVKPGEGAGFGAVVGALVGLGVALIPGVGPVLAAGPFAAALMAGIGAAAGAATGGVVAALVDFGVPEEEAHVYAEGLRRGGTLVSATVDDAWATRVEEVMNRHQPVDIERRADYWREQGWGGFESVSSPYNADEIETERSAYRGYLGGPGTSTSGQEIARTGATPPSTYSGENYRMTDSEEVDRYGVGGPELGDDEQVDRMEDRQTYNTYGTTGVTTGNRARTYWREDDERNNRPR